jgi:iodotyrosine deiodinase
MIEKLISGLINDRSALFPVLILLILGLFIVKLVIYFTNDKSVDDKRVNKANDKENNEEDEQEPENFDLRPSLENVTHIPYKPEKLSPDQMLIRSEDFYNLMNKRRTVRQFSTEPVDKQIIYNLIKTAGTSPSGAHTEPWTYVLISTPEMKEKIRKIVEEEEELNYRRRMSRIWVTDLEPFRTNWDKPYLTDVPHLILIFKQVHSFKPDGSKRFHYYNEESTCISAGILLTAIQNAGLATLTSTPLNCGPKIRLLLNRPNYEKLIFLLPVGYPSDTCEVPDLNRKPLNEFLIEY